MRKLLSGCLGIALMTAFAVVQAKAESYYSECNPCEAASCNPCDSSEENNIFCNPCDAICGPKKSLWFVGGHIEGGVYANEYGRKDTYPYGLNPGNSDFLHNVRQTSGQVNQLYINGGKLLDSRRGWSWGGKVGYMFGTDARYAQSRGLEYASGHGGYRPGRFGKGAWGSGDYYSALTEAYFETGYKKLSVKVGKFFTPMGHEGLLSTDRFFYSLSDSFGMLPVTHSGALFTYDAGKRFQVFAGWVQGYRSPIFGSNATDVLYEDMFFETSHNNAFLGGFRWDVNKRLYVKYSALIGRDTAAYDGSRDNMNRNYFAQSLVAGYKLNKRWDYTFEWTLKNDKAKPEVNHNDYWGGYGINNELLYRLNKKWAIGARAEWAHAYISCDHLGLRDHYDKYSLTLGANWTPRSWILVRPELRYDKFDGRDDLFREKDGTRRNKQFSGGVSAVVMF